MWRLPQFLRLSFLPVLVLGAFPALAGELHVAVAVNFAASLTELTRAFTQETGHRVLVSSGSTGKLYAQIQHGAPYDVFLAADAERPRLLEAAGQAVAGSRFTYARGQLVLWSRQPNFIDPQGKVLHQGNFKHLALANPKIAPYGAAAQEVLAHLKLWETLQPRVVRGEDIGQVAQFVQSGNAQLGFIALSQARQIGRGSYWQIPQNFYTPLAQQAVLLQRARDNPAAKAWLAYLRSPPAQSIIKNLGYEI